MLIFLTKRLDKLLFVYYISNRQRGNTRRLATKVTMESRGSDSLLHSLSSGLWVPKYILECPISFSPFLPFGAFGNTAGNGGVFLFPLRRWGIIYQTQKTVPNGHCPQTGRLGSVRLIYIHQIAMFLRRASMLPGYRTHKLHDAHQISPGF